MGALMLLRFLVILLWPSMITSALPMAMPNCPDKCGNISVPYPFGFGDDKSCYRSQFKLTCNNSYNPPKLFTGSLEVFRLSLQGQQYVSGFVAKDCYNSLGQRTYRNNPWMIRRGYPIFTFSDTQNKFIVIGCDTYAYIEGSNGRNFTSGCNMICNNKDDVINSTSCAGIGCCETSIPKGFRDYNISLYSYNHHINVIDFNPCSYAFLVDVNWFNFSFSDLLNFTNNVDAEGYSQVPVVYDWAVDNKTCEQAKQDPTTYACGNNSVCDISKNGVGYSCNCSQGYQGNPYLPNGCQDINECVEEPTKNNCTFMDHCNNLPGNYSCSCPHGYRGDGRKDGTGCRRPPYPVIQVTVGTGLGSLFLLIGSLLVLYAIQKRKDTILKQKFFVQNGGDLLKQLLSHEGLIEGAKIYKEAQLKHATNNYAESQILGQGGHGRVYKGVFPCHKIVAIKRSKIFDESQIKHFINEVFILSKLNHRNVVKLLGCCLETEVPLLVYEFVANKTLYYHIHDEGRDNKPVSWDYRLRIATDTSEALAYLHSASSPIIHRDIKSTNILLDDNLMAKVADFGVSRLVPRDKTHVSTFARGTVGYSDPEYNATGQLTEKSDVYSFGIVLAELLTGKTATFYIDGSSKETHLGTYFLTLFKEGRIWDFIDDQIKIEGYCKEQLKEFMELIERCLEEKGEKRPTMKEVEIVLYGLRRYDMHPLVAQNPEEVECLLGESSDFYGSKTIDYNSMPAQEMISLKGGR